MTKDKDLYRGGLNAGTWSAVFSGRRSDPSHANPAILKNEEWRRGWVDGNAEYFRNKEKANVR